MKKVNNYQKAKVQSQDVAWLLLKFYQFQPGVANKSITYKTNMSM